MQSSAARSRARVAGILVLACVLATPFAGAQERPKLVVQIAADSALSWNGKPVTLPELRTLMREAVRASPDTPPELSVRAAEKVRYGFVMQILTLAQDAGFDPRLGTPGGSKE